jgi:phospholipase C
MGGFIKSYATQGAGGDSSHAIMNYFAPEKIPALTKLATEYAVFNGWFSSIPGPTICNRAFAHYGTSFGNVDMNLFLVACRRVTITRLLASKLSWPLAAKFCSPSNSIPT